MDVETLYEIARYRESGHQDELIDRFELVCNSDSSLILRDADGHETRCDGDDAVSIIAADKDLHIVRPNELTRIEGTKELRAELPLLLRVLDEDAALDSFEVYVNHEFWGAVRGVDRMLLTPCRDVAIPRIDDEWARISLTAGSFTSGTDTTYLGLLTPTVVADFYDPDCEDSRMTVFQRGDDAEMVADWLLNGQLSRNLEVRELLVQLFIEAVKSPETTVKIVGEQLAAGGIVGGFDGEFGARGEEWNLGLSMDFDVRDSVPARLREHGGRIAAMVEGWLDPDSSFGRARATALKELDEYCQRRERDLERKRDRDGENATAVPATQRASNARPLTTTTSRRPRRPTGTG